MCSLIVRPSAARASFIAVVYNWCYGRHASTSYPLLLLSPHARTLLTLPLPSPFAISVTSTHRIKCTTASTVRPHHPLTRSSIFSKNWSRLFPGFSILAGSLRSCTTGSFSRFCGLSSHLPAFPLNRPLLSAASRLQPSTTLRLCGYSTSSCPTTSDFSHHGPPPIHYPLQHHLPPKRREPQLPYTTVPRASPTTPPKKKGKKKKRKSKKKKKQKKMYSSSSDDNKPLARSGNRTNGKLQLRMMI